MHVYYIGINNNGCSGIDTKIHDAIGGKKCYISPRKVDALCKQQIINIASGGNSHVFAITKSGRIYSWGYNGSFELGHGTNTPNPNPSPTKIDKLCQFQVKQVACGSGHSMALTKDGKVHIVIHKYMYILHSVCIVYVLFKLHTYSVVIYVLEYLKIKNLKTE